jgi:hypothetical protein
MQSRITINSVFGERDFSNRRLAKGELRFFETPCRGGSSAALPIRAFSSLDWGRLVRLSFCLTDEMRPHNEGAGLR